MSIYKLVTIDQRFIAETIARTGSEQLLTKVARSFVGLYNQEENWYIPLRANLGKKKPEGAYFETPFRTDNSHFKRPGLDFEKAIFVPIEYTIDIRNTLPKDQSEFIADHQKAIKSNFEKYVLRIDELSKRSPSYKFSTVPLFPEGIKKIKQIHAKKIENKFEQKENPVMPLSNKVEKIKKEHGGKSMDATIEKVPEKEEKSIQEIIKKKDYKALSAHLKEGVASYLETDTFKNYLGFIAKFHKYSQRNVRLLLAQNPTISRVAGFKKWQEVDRNVRKGSKALYVYAPGTRIVKDKNGTPLTDENGQIVKENYFFLTPVFDVSQTSGKELPKPIYELEGNFERPEQFVNVFHAIETLSPVPIKIEEIKNGANGYYHLENQEIVLKTGLGEVMTLKTLIHEVTHAKLHSDSTCTFGDKEYSQQEFEAESVAYIVSNHLGIDTSDYSFGYLSSWTEQGKSIDDFTNSLDRITKEAQEIIDSLDHSLSLSFVMDQPENKFEERVAIARGREVSTEIKSEVTQTKSPTKEPKTVHPK